MLQPARSPGWMRKLSATVNRALQPMEPIALLSWQWDEPRKRGDYWLISMYPTPTEIVGGREDGRVFVGPFALDLAPVVAEFDSMPTIRWFMTDAVGQEMGDLGGPMVQFIGLIKRRLVCFQFYGLPPMGEPATMVIDKNTGEFRDHMGLPSI